MAAHDEVAAAAFVHRYERRVYGLAYAMLHDASGAEDVAQEAFLRAWRHAAIFDPRRGSVPTWLLTITRRLAIDALRLRRTVAVSDSELDQLVARAARPRGPDPGVEDGAVHIALTCLPLPQRRAVVLAGLYGLTAAEVSAREQIPLGTAKSRIRLGLARLEQALRDNGESA